MTLQKVRSMGTEGRREGENDIPPAPYTYYDLIKFKVE
jgi:hypothetical protein